MFRKSFFVVGALLTSFSYPLTTPDLMVVGHVNFHDGLGRTAYGFIDQLGDLLQVTQCGPCDMEDDPYQIQHRFFHTIEIKPARMYVDVRALGIMVQKPLWPAKTAETPVRYGYTVWESSLLPPATVARLNQDFDALLVADSFLLDVYKNSGITAPVFCLPSIVYLEKFLQEPTKECTRKPFTFGCSAAPDQKRKNLKKLIIAFERLYGNNPDFLLKIHAKEMSTLKVQESVVLDELDDLSLESALQDIVVREKSEEESDYEYVERMGLTNVIISSDMMTESDYLEFLKTLDCYVLISMGEGFSITPREAMALGVPCILTDNTAHTTICKSGCVLPVACYPIQAWQGEYGDDAGCQFDCHTEDVMAAMQEMVTDYAAYFEKAQRGRQWVKRYLGSLLQKEYLTFFAPQHVVLSNENRTDVTTGTLYTNDLNLFYKMKKNLKEEHAKA